MEAAKPKGLSTEAKAAAIILALIVCIVGVSVAIDKFIIVPQSGNVHSVGLVVYWDEALTSKVINMSWGNVEPNSTATPQLTFLHNTGDQPVIYTFSTPDIPSYLTESWNYTGAIAQPNSVTPVEWYLYVDAAAPSNTPFKFDLYVEVTIQ